jgi:hypothetical protein
VDGVSVQDLRLHLVVARKGRGPADEMLERSALPS